MRVAFCVVNLNREGKRLIYNKRLLKKKKKANGTILDLYSIIA